MGVVDGIYLYLYIIVTRDEISFLVKCKLLSLKLSKVGGESLADFYVINSVCRLERCYIVETVVLHCECDVVSSCCYESRGVDAFEFRVGIFCHHNFKVVEVPCVDVSGVALIIDTELDVVLSHVGSAYLFNDRIGSFF